MSLSTNITLTVSDYDVKLSRNLKFYERDQLKLIFTLNYWGIDNTNGVTQKTLMPLNALSAILFIETPLGVDSIESATIEENVVTFHLTSNQTQHIGVSRMQIQLSDEDGCQITLPPMEFEVRENIYDDEVILSQVLLADEDENIVVDENGNAVNTGTQVSTQTYAIALSAKDKTTATTSQPTKQIKDFNLKSGVSGKEDLLIQDSDGVTKRIKVSEFLSVDVDLTLYYTKEEVDTLLNNKADVTHIHTVADIEDMPDLTKYALKTDVPTVPTKTSELANDVGFITTIPKEYITETELDAKGYLTEHIDISGKANVSDLATVATSGDYNDLLNKPTVTNGVDGKSAYEIYVENTTETPLTETEWLSSLKGVDGEQGIQGENGATFMPSVDSLGNLSWTNDKGLTNPNTINIKGEKGDKGDKGEPGTTTWEGITNKPTNLATETYVNNKIIPNLIGNTVTNKTLTLTVDKYQYAVLSNGNSIKLPSVSSFTEIHLFFKASADLTLTFPSVRWQSIPSITSGHTYEIIFTYVVDEWLAGVICYE